MIAANSNVTVDAITSTRLASITIEKNVWHM